MNKEKDPRPVIRPEYLGSKYNKKDLKYSSKDMDRALLIGISIGVVIGIVIGVLMKL